MIYRFLAGSNRRDWALCVIFLVTIYFFLMHDLPADIPNSPHDDDLFIGQALSISSGDWLGEDYGKFTLIKGPYHSVQIWLSSVLGAPPMLGLRMFYAAVCALFCSVALSKLPTILKSLALLCLLFDPVLIGDGWRLLRSVSFVPVEVLALACGICAFDSIACIGAENPALRVNKWKTLSISLVSSYFCLGLLLITREARIVIVFTSLVYTFLLLAQAYRYSFASRKALPRLLLIALALLLVFNLPVISVKELNRMNYGLAISNEFEEGGFKTFYQNLSSVKLTKTDHQPFIPIKKAVISAIIDLDSQSQLATTLSNLNQGWTKHGCNINANWCDEYASGWFMWALRDAIFKTSSINSPREFQDQISNLNRELREVCAVNSNILTCKTSSFGYLPYPSRWVTSDQSPLRVFADTSLAHFSWLTSPRVLNHYGAVTPADEQARNVGVRLTSGYSSAELTTFTQRIAKLAEFSSFIRMILFISFAIAFLAVIIWRPRLIVCLLDPGLVFIATLLMANFFVLVLVQVTSFPSTGYLSLVSPLTTLFVWRYYDRLLINFKSKSLSQVSELTSI